jgi:hypothetical protein
MASRVRRPDSTTPLVPGGSAEAPVDPGTVVGGAINTYSEKAPGQVDLSAPERIANTLWTREGLSPLAEKMMNVIMAAVVAVSAQIDEPNAGPNAKDPNKGTRPV